MENSGSILKGHFRHKRRSTRDRRNYKSAENFPMITLGGYMVYKDRRFNPERRIRNIDVSEKFLNESEFIKLFNKVI
jgi:hypothetical protein